MTKVKSMCGSKLTCFDIKYYVFHVDPMVGVWIREFLLGRTQTARVGRQLSEEVRVTSGVPQGSILCPLLFLAYVNDIWKNMESTIRLFADDCVIYRKIIHNEGMENLQKDLNRLGKWVVENAMKINPSKSKAIRFTRARVKGPLNYSLMDTLIPEASSYKYLGIILRSHLSWADHGEKCLESTTFHNTNTNKG